MPTNAPPDNSALERRVARLTMAVIGLAILWLATAAWAVFVRPRLPAVLAVERLEIREPDGQLAFALANSAYPTTGTLDGQVLLADQAEERRFPNFIYFDGNGDEVGGLLVRTVDGPDGTATSRFLTFDGLDHQEVLVLGHTQAPDGSSTSLRMMEHEPGATLIGGMRDLGIEPGVTRAEMEAAIAAIPEAERSERLRQLVGTLRLRLGIATSGEAGLTLNDAEGRPRVVIEAPASGAPSLRFLDENGQTLLRLPE